MKDVKSRVAEIVDPLRKPSVMLERCEGESTSYLGGRPPMFPAFTWPRRHGRPLGFLACLDLGRFSAMPWLPKAGRLLFFCDLVEQPWGSHPNERGSWSVQYVPEGTPIEGLAPFPSELRAQHRLAANAVAFRVASVPPPFDLTPMCGQEIPEDESDQLFDALDALRDAEYGVGPRHQVGGYADPIQGANMEWICQEMVGGGRSKADWRLLLQLDSDRALPVTWGPCGRIYFWVREQDAHKCDFRDAWLTHQCG